MDETVGLEANLSVEKEYISNNLYVNGSVLEKAVDNGNILIELSGSELELSAVYPQYPLICSSPVTVVIFT